MAKDNDTPAASKPLTATQQIPVLHAQVLEERTARVAAEGLVVAKDTEITLLHEELDRQRPIIEENAKWGIPTEALLHSQTARQKFEENAANKIQENSMSDHADPHAKPAGGSKSAGSGGAGKKIEHFVSSHSAWWWIKLVLVGAVAILLLMWVTGNLNRPVVNDAPAPSSSSQPAPSSSEEPKPSSSAESSSGPSIEVKISDSTMERVKSMLDDFNKTPEPKPSSSAEPASLDQPETKASQMLKHAIILAVTAFLANMDPAAAATSPTIDVGNGQMCGHGITATTAVPDIACPGDSAVIDISDDVQVANNGGNCPPLGSADFYRLNPKPSGKGWKMVEHIPNQPCGGWAHTGSASVESSAPTTNSGAHCPTLGSAKFLQLNPRPAGDGWQMVEHVPNMPCGGWARTNDGTRADGNNAGIICPVLGTPEFLQANPKPQDGRHWEMVDQVPGKACGGWVTYD